MNKFFDWAILPQAKEYVSELLKSGKCEDEEAASDNHLAPKRSIDLVAGVGIIPVHGAILPHDNATLDYFGASYTSIDFLHTALELAMDNDGIEHIVLDIESPGGAVQGVASFVDTLASYRGNKPITAVVSGLGASAAYWIASAADEIVIDQTASVGSIGVVTTVMDTDEAYEKEGIKMKDVTSSNAPKKRTDPFTEEGEKELIEHLDEIESIFISAVAKNRGVTTETVKKDFGQGDVLVGQSAVQAGLADRVGTLSSVMHGITNFNNKSNNGDFEMAKTEKNSDATAESITETAKVETNLDNEEIKVEEQAAEAQAEETTETIEAEVEAPVSLEEQIEAARAEGAQAERERVSAIRGLALAGQEGLADDLVAQGSNVEDAMREFLSNAKDIAYNVQDTTNEEKDITSVDGSASKAVNISNLSLEDMCKHKWESGDKEAKEHFSLNSYIAYERNNTK